MAVIIIQYTIINNHLKMATHLDYYNTFFASVSGKRVLADIRKVCGGWFRSDKDTPLSSDEAYAQCVLDQLLMLIDENLGLSSEESISQMIDYQAKISNATLEIEPPPDDTKRLHDTD